MEGSGVDAASVARVARVRYSSSWLSTDWMLRPPVPALASPGSATPRPCLTSLGASTLAGLATSLTPMGGPVHLEPSAVGSRDIETTLQPSAPSMGGESKRGDASARGRSIVANDGEERKVVAGMSIGMEARFVATGCCYASSAVVQCTKMCMKWDSPG